MAIRNIFLVAHTWLLCAVTLLVAGISAPSFAGTQIAGSRQQVCNVIIEYPSRMEFGLENATCDQNGNLVGQHSISITVDLAIRNGVRFTFDSNFLNGRLNGLTSIKTDAGFSFDGEIFPGGRTVGRTISFDGSVVEGETRGGVANLTGTVTRRNGQVIYYINGRESDAIAFANNQSPNHTSSKVSLARATPSPLIISEMTTVDLGQSQFCLADLPAAQYEISGVFSGRCKDRYYTGKAKLTLTPKQGSGVLPMIATLKYQSGQIIGPVDISYIDSEAEYKGTLQNWTPLAGTLSEPIGNDEYRVVDIAEGLSVAERTEHREPSFGKQLLERVAKVALVNLQDCLSGGCEQERLAEQARRDRKAQERQTAIYEQQQAQIREQQRQNDLAIQAENDRYKAEQANIRSQQLAAIEDARIKQLAGLDRDGNPIVQPAVAVVIARNDPPPVFVVDTRPPAPTVTTNPQVDPPAITTQAPELALPTAGINAPPPLPSGQPIPEQSPAPLAPPVQLGGGGDTLETGQPVPSYPVPQPEPVVGPATPSQPASNASTQNYGSTPAAYAQQLSESDLALNNRLSPSNPQRIENQMSAGQLGQIIRSGQIADWRTETQAAINRQNGTQTAGNSAGSGGSQTADILQALALAAPRPLAPTNPGELNPTVPLQWSGVTGATYYQLAVRDLTTNDLVVNLSVNGTSHTASPYTAGRSFRWNVAACNAAGCSPNRSESWTFRTGGSTNTSQIGESLASNAWVAASQGTKDCAITLARETGESLESAFQLVTSSGGWQQVAGSVANSAWNIIRHPILSVKAAWNGLTGQVSGVREAVNAGNPSLACQRAVKLSATVIATADGIGATKASLGSLRRVKNDTGEIAAAVEKNDSGPQPSRRVYTVLEYQKHHDDIVKKLQADLDDQGITAFREASFSGVCQIDGRCRTDLIAHNDRGGLVIIEVKTGGASLSIRQMAIYPQISSGQAVPMGQIAKDLGLKAGITLKEQGYPNGIKVLEYRYPGLSGQ